ncbi:MAG: hydroxymethylbilane synthase [Conexivisphaerales archaeon]
MMRLGTRPSKLAMIQAEMVSERIASITNEKVKIVPVTTEGDLSGKQEPNLKSAFTKRLEDAIANGAVDAAVHSLKDFPLQPMDGLALVSFPISHDPSDYLVTESGTGLFDLKQGAEIGTGSARRKSLIEFYRPDIYVRPMRGNVDTRIKKYREIGLDGVVLSGAGLTRLELKVKYQRLNPEFFIPAAGQGIIAVEAKEGSRIAMLMNKINDNEAETRARAERAFLKTLGGDCNVPAGIYTRIYNGKIFLKGFIASGKSVKFSILFSKPASAWDAGTELAGVLLS